MSTRENIRLIARTPFEPWALPHSEMGLSAVCDCGIF